MAANALGAIIAAACTGIVTLIGAILHSTWQGLQAEIHATNNVQERIERRLTRLESMYDLHLITAHDLLPKDSPFAKKYVENPDYRNDD